MDCCYFLGPHDSPPPLVILNIPSLIALLLLLFQHTCSESFKAISVTSSGWPWDEDVYMKPTLDNDALLVYGQFVVIDHQYAILETINS